MTMKILFIL